ncbi:MAG: hypothetical protein OSJ43_11655 [Oscillospiraceae bacterium]|nr:hypothetical protein [Oscillospiraceae bacterium]
MAEYIERGEMKEVLKKSGISTRFADIPKTADIRPERHGYWIDKTQWYGHLGRILTQCSECGFEIEGDPTSRNTGMGGKYCENCGAKMNGKPKRLRDITKKNGNGEE